MAEEIARGIYKLDIPLFGSPLKNLNSYYISDPNRGLLIDTGFNSRSCLDAMKKELSALSIDMEKTDIFITHMHADHVGLSQELATESTKIFMSPTDKVYLESLFLSDVNERLAAEYTSEGFPPEEFEDSMKNSPMMRVSPAKHARFFGINDGDILNCGDHELTCISTPGHTPGHTCLYCGDKKLMFLGDHVLFDITPNIVRWPGFKNSLKEYLANLKKISSYDTDIALPAHRAVDCSVKERAETIKKHHENRLSEVSEIIRDDPGITAYAIAGRMQWDIRCDSWEDFPPVQKMFAVGETLAHIDYLYGACDIAIEERGGVNYYFPRV